jgi:hypothetical protein
LEGKKEDLEKAQRIKDPAEREAAIAELERAAECTANLPAPVLYPLMPREDDDEYFDDENDILFDEYEEPLLLGTVSPAAASERGRRRRKGGGADIRTGIPELPLILLVDIQGKFGKERSIMAFQQTFGNLPARAMYEMTEMMYRASTRSKRLQVASASGYFCTARQMGIPSHSRTQKMVGIRCPVGGSGGGGVAGSDQVSLPMDIFLPEPMIMEPYSRLKAFKPDAATMNSFKSAGCHMHMLKRIMDVVTNTKDPVRKIAMFNDYLARIIRQHVSSVLNNDLRSSNALNAVRYIEQARFTVCNDLRKLLNEVRTRIFLAFL